MKINQFRADFSNNWNGRGELSKVSKGPGVKFFSLIISTKKGT